MAPAKYTVAVLLVLALSPCNFAHAQTTLDEAKALNERAVALYRAGNAGEAIPLAKRALAIREKALPAGHPDIATSLDNLASLYQDQGRLTEAEPLFKRALEMREKALPAGHQQIAGSLNNLAAVYKSLDRYIGFSHEDLEARLLLSP